MSVKRVKLFCGIALDDRVREKCKLVADRLAANGLPARYEDAAKYHITLAFIGWVEESRVDEIAAAAARAASGLRPFTVHLDKIGAFPNERNPHVVWLGAREQGPQFRSLASGVREAYEALNFTFDKPAVAHITLARIKTQSAHLPLLEIEPIAVEVRALTLFQSLPAGGTTRYEVLESFDLYQNGV